MFASCWDRESQAVRGLAGSSEGLRASMAWRGVEIVEAHPDENYLQVLNIQQRVFGWQDASPDLV